jgi:GNAT superfamily N-acetyltransferase
MIFADLGLARRLERAEAEAGRRIVEARHRLAPQIGACRVEIAGAAALFDGPASPCTQSFGLGLDGVPGAADLDRLEAFFLERGAPVCHELSPLIDVAVTDALVRRGYRPVDFTNVLYQKLPAAPHDKPAAPGLPTRRMAPGEEVLWSELSAKGWGEFPEFTDFLLNLGRVMAATEGSICLFAELDGAPVATGKLACAGGVALLGGASTVPAARRRGAQRALLEARLALAAESGCDLVMMCAHPGTDSQRNAERQGFRIAYTRTKWQLAPKR